MRVALVTAAMVATTAITAIAQAPCQGLVFQATCAGTTAPKLRATFGAAFTPAPLPVASAGHVPAALTYFMASPRLGGPALSTASPASAAIDCSMLKHTTFSDDAKIVRQTHPAYPNARDVISVPSCANSATSTAKK